MFLFDIGILLVSLTCFLGSVQKRNRALMQVGTSAFATWIAFTVLLLMSVV